MTDDAALAARKELIESHLWLAQYLAKKSQGWGLTLAELESAAYLGLTQAAMTYKADLGQFRTYAGLAIRNELREEIGSNRLVHLPHRVRRYVGKWRKWMATNPGGEFSEFAKAMKLRKKQAAIIARVLGGDTPNVELGPDNVNWDSLPGAADSHHDPIEAFDSKDAVKAILKKATPDDRRFVKLRFGLTGSREHTFQEMGDRIGLSRQRTNQIWVETRARLRDRAEVLGLTE